MISEERLSELYQNQRTIYWNQPFGDSVIKREVDFSKIGITEIANNLYLKDITDKLYNIELEDLYETKEDAEFALEFCNIQRIKKLHLPTWEEVYKDLKNEEEGDYTIAEWEDVSFEYERNLIADQILLFSKYEKYNWNASKENYIEACRMAKKLFLSKED